MRASVTRALTVRTPAVTLADAPIAVPYLDTRGSRMFLQEGVDVAPEFFVATQIGRIEQGWTALPIPNVEGVERHRALPQRSPRSPWPGFALVWECWR